MFTIFGGIKLDQLTLFAGASHVNRSPTPGSAKARKITAISGLHLLQLYENSGRVGPLSRMFLASSLWGSTRCFLTWRDWATPQKRLLFRLVPSMPITVETGSGLLPTPCAADAERHGRGTLYELFNQVGRYKLLPTPDTNEWKSGAGFSPEGRGHTPQLRHLANGQIGPEFIEWMLGFPIGWTDLER